MHGVRPPGRLKGEAVRSHKAYVYLSDAELEAIDGTRSGEQTRGEVMRRALAIYCALTPAERELLALRAAL